MSKITNKHIIKIKELIQDQVNMGTFGLVELELLDMEKELKKDSSCCELTKQLNEDRGLGYDRCLYCYNSLKEEK